MGTRVSVVIYQTPLIPRDYLLGFIKSSIASQDIIKLTVVVKGLMTTLDNKRQNTKFATYFPLIHKMLLRFDHVSKSGCISTCPNVCLETTYMYIWANCGIRSDNQCSGQKFIL